MSEINYTSLLNFLNKKKITYLFYDKSFKTWESGDSRGELARGLDIFDCLEKTVSIFENYSRLDFEDILYEEEAWFNANNPIQEIYESAQNNKEMHHYLDEGILNYLNMGAFNYIWLDKITNNWILGDKKTMIPAAYSQDIRKLAII